MGVVALNKELVVYCLKMMFKFS